MGATQTYNNGEGVPAPGFYKPNQPYGCCSSAAVTYENLAIDSLGNLLFTIRQRMGYSPTPDYVSILRITDADKGDAANNNWFINHIDAQPSGLAADPDTKAIYFSGLGKVPNPNGTGSTDVHAINVLKP